MKRKYQVQKKNPTWIKSGERKSPGTEFKVGHTPYNKGKLHLGRESHPMWKGGRRTTSNGYIEVRCPEHPRARRNGYIYEHVLVAEQALGRYLKDGEHVHHLNGIKTDNRPQNFVICRNPYHRWLEGRMAFIGKQLLFGGVWRLSYTVEKRSYGSL